MARWSKVVGWMAVAWTAAIALSVSILLITGGCADVPEADRYVCELDRDSTVSGLALVWFIGFLPAAVIWLLARARRPRCRICGDELAGADRGVCRSCGTRLVRSAARGE